MSLEDKLRNNQDKIDEVVLKWIGRHVIMTDPTSDISIKGKLTFYDGGRIFIENASSNMIEGSKIIYFLNGSMAISLVDDASKTNATSPGHGQPQGKVVELYPDKSESGQGEDQEEDQEED